MCRIPDHIVDTSVLLCGTCMSIHVYLSNILHMKIQFWSHMFQTHVCQFEVYVVVAVFWQVVLMLGLYGNTE